MDSVMHFLEIILLTAIVFSLGYLFGVLMYATRDIGTEDE